MQKIGIFGGTFSPPHNGHVAAARAFLSELSLDRLIVMPANIPPHKEALDLPSSARLEMARLAFDGMERTEVSDYEVNTPGKSYTANTLTHLATEGARLYFLCGTDMFTTLENWYRPDVICSLATIVLAKRDTDSDAETDRANNTLTEKFGARTLILKHSPTVLSSTLIRSRIARGEDVSELIPPSVLEYIKENRLYKKL